MSYQDVISVDQYHVTISQAQVKSSLLKTGQLRLT